MVKCSTVTEIFTFDLIHHWRGAAFQCRDKDQKCQPCALVLPSFFSFVF